MASQIHNNCLQHDLSETNIDVGTSNHNSPENIENDNNQASNQEGTNMYETTTYINDSIKQIIKHYCKEMFSFAMNKIVKPYLAPLLITEGIKKREFMDYIGIAKESIKDLHSFLDFLLIKSTDEKTEAAYKRTFQTICVIFIKHFSVNWIFSGNMNNKNDYLQLRFKMLRRIKNPELFIVQNTK